MRIQSHLPIQPVSPPRLPLLREGGWSKSADEVSLDGGLGAAGGAIVGGLAGLCFSQPVQGAVVGALVGGATSIASNYDPDVAEIGMVAIAAAGAAVGGGLAAAIGVGLGHCSPLLVVGGSVLGAAVSEGAFLYKALR